MRRTRVAVAQPSGITWRSLPGAGPAGVRERSANVQGARSGVRWRGEPYGRRQSPRIRDLHRFEVPAARPCDAAPCDWMTRGRGPARDPRPVLREPAVRPSGYSSGGRVITPSIVARSAIRDWSSASPASAPHGWSGRSHHPRNCGLDAALARLGRRRRGVSALPQLDGSRGVQLGGAGRRSARVLPGVSLEPHHPPAVRSGRARGVGAAREREAPPHLLPASARATARAQPRGRRAEPGVLVHAGPSRQEQDLPGSANRPRRRMALPNCERSEPVL